MKEPRHSVFVVALVIIGCYKVDGAANCNDITCYNNGRCKVSGGKATCTCAAGFSGKLCCKYADNCQQNPCENGGTCYNDGDLRKCICTPGYEGTTCTEDINDCRGNPCLNGGQCKDDLNSFSCQCDAGYTGDTCGTGNCKRWHKDVCLINDGSEIDECSSNPCQHGGTCYDLIASYKCSCTNGYKGNDCETKVDLCENKPCLNGATCSDKGDTFSCMCADGYTGDTCGVGK
ncbi:hypothetical protein LSH36_1535g00000 [Paralvinella palmiformis]|uniref:EGF-like domain-containing protein n=1 Tax=Paralvinella palmiformis TaxID=53620 RepID=A0AAD9IS59_9ANNE|nr:hypothetical protein LSH36_1535g00000 [Paralvinella palmiformis]